MTETNADDLSTLARAMGYTVTLDDSGGYGVVRVVIGGIRGKMIDASGRVSDVEHQRTAAFCPHLDAAQAWEVMAWLMHTSRATISANTVWCKTKQADVDHDGTAAGIRRAVVEAAIRVAKS